MALMGTFALYGVSFAVAYAMFVGARYLAGSVFRVGERVPPFGEAPPSGFEQARPGARLAITLAGPLGVYILASFLTTLGLLLGASHGPGTTIVAFLPESPAKTAGLREGDRITMVAATRVAIPSDLGRVLTANAEALVEVVIERQGHEARFQVPVGQRRRLGVQLGPNHESIGVGFAIRDGAAYPFRVLFGAATALANHAHVEVVGPVGMARITAREPVLAERLLSVGIAQSIAVIFFLLGSVALWPPRVSGRAAPVIAGAVSGSPGTTDVAGRPGVRAIARAIDWSLFLLFLTLIARPATALLSVVSFPLEALFLCTWGFTPGKWLLRIAVRDGQGGRPRFRVAFHRAAILWAYGVGADTPFGLATAVLAYADLKRNRTTYWDTVGGFTVHHGRVGVARVAIAVGALVVLLAATAIAASVG